MIAPALSWPKHEGVSPSWDPFGPHSHEGFRMVFFESVGKTQDDLVSLGFVGALAGRFRWFVETLKNTRPIQTRRIGGPGEGRERGI